MANEKVLTTSRSEDLTDQEIVELFERFSPSQPIRIPTKLLSPEYEYRWINRAKPSVFTRRKGVGWRPIAYKDMENYVRDGVEVEDLHLGTHVTPDGLLGISDDLVFACIPKRYAVAYRRHRARKNEERRTAGRRRFHQAGELMGVATEENL